MGQKVHPTGFRVGIIQGWGSNWFAEKSKFAEFLYADWKIREYINKRYPNHGISKISIERKTDKAVKLTVFSAKPGVIIGQGGQDVEKLRDALEKLEGRQVFINVKEVKEFATNAKLIAETVSQMLERRQSFRRAMGQAIIRARRMGCEGIKVRVSGRLGGAEMSRVEWAKEGRVPLHTIRADIDYGTARANTAFGVIGVKAWVFNGEVYPEKRRSPKAKAKVKD